MSAAVGPSEPDHPTDDLWQLLGWAPDAAQVDLFRRLQQELRSWNGRLNLTRLVEGDDFWVAQVMDSLWPLHDLLADPDADPDCIDVGTGGGFPGLVVAIALPRARLTLVDSVGRKTEAVRAMARALGLEERVTLRCERVERTGQERACRGRFDLAMARAVASAPVVAEYLLPLLRPDGRALLYRGQWSDEDGLSLDRALGPLNGRLDRVERLDLPGDRGVRHALTLRGVAPCPAAYPRPVGVPSKQPLGSLP